MSSSTSISSSSKGHSDSLVKERRLRPIYELLDSNNNKRVVQEVDRLLKKQPNFTCAKVLKALALLRLGKNSECEAIVTPIFNETPTDENTIQALSICYRELDQPEMVCKLLERASKEDKNEDLMTHCFMAHVRVSDFQKQHQTALQLYKMFPKIPYFSWAVMSLLVKVERDADPASLRISLPLAERMMSKFIEENKIESEHEYCLYILILRKQGNYRKILEILTGPSGKKISVTTGFFHRIVVECLRKTNDLTSLITFLQEAIKQQPDEWDFYKEYIECFAEKQTERVCNLLKGKEKNIGDNEVARRPLLLAQLLFIKTVTHLGIDHQFDLTKILIDYVTLYGNKPFYFADIKGVLGLLKQDDDKSALLLAAKNIQNEPLCYLSVDDVQRKMNYTFLMRYFVGDEMKNSAKEIMDFVQMCIKCYLDVRDEQIEANPEWCSRNGLTHDEFMAVAAMTLMESYWNTVSIWDGYFTECKNKANINKSENVKGERKLLLEKLKMFAEVRNKCSRDADETGVQKSVENCHEGQSDNPELSLSNCTLIDQHDMEINTKPTTITNGFAKIMDANNKSIALKEEELPILVSLCMLEYVLERSPNWSQVRLLLAKAYMRCGAIGAGADIIIGLDLKHIQWESLGYLYIWKLQTSGFYREAVRILHMAENFYTTYQKESMEHVLSAYKYGSWEKILEFLEFRDLLLNSVQCGLITVEKELLQFTMSCYTQAQTLKIAREVELDQISQHFVNHERYTDNRDMAVLLTYGDKKPSEQLKKLTFEAEIERLKIRSLILSLLTNFVLLPSKERENFTVSLKEIENMLALLQKASEFDVSVFSVPTPSVDEMWSPPIYQYTKAGYFNVLLNLFTLNFEMAKESKDARICTLTTNIEAALKEMVQHSIKSWKPKVASFLRIGDVIEDAFYLTETLGFCCILLDVCGSLIKKSLTLMGRTKKKKSKEALDFVYCEQFNGLVNTVSDLINAVVTEMSSFEFTNCNIHDWSKLSSSYAGKVCHDLHAYILPFSLPTVMAKLHQSYTKSISEMAINIKIRQKYISSLFIPAGP